MRDDRPLCPDSKPGSSNLLMLSYGVVGKPIETTLHALKATRARMMREQLWTETPLMRLPSREQPLLRVGKPMESRKIGIVVRVSHK